jgi:molybdate transport system regulatory protein
MRLFIRCIDGEVQLGPGKIRLLELIDSHGSISEAARSMDMSYRRAWLLIADLNRNFREPVTSTQTGGKGGGHAKLTDFGHDLIARYRAIERDATAAVSDKLIALKADIIQP